jgi:hypothetical protein
VKDTPLTYELRDDELVVRIGVAVLAASQEPRETPYKVLPGMERHFALDVLLNLQREEEDGSTSITRALDQACDHAVEDGSDAVYDIAEHDEDVEETEPHGDALGERKMP